MEASETARLIAPSLRLPYFVLWYENGRILARGFDTYEDAQTVFNHIQFQHEALRDKIKPDVRVYCGIILEGFEDVE